MPLVVVGFGLLFSWIQKKQIMYALSNFFWLFFWLAGAADINSLFMSAVHSAYSKYSSIGRQQHIKFLSLPYVVDIQS